MFSIVKKQSASLALLIVPLVVSIVGYFFLKAAFPLHSGSAGYDQDPAYAYLFNGLLILDGQAPHHIDHPGTPLQIIFAVVIVLRWQFSKVFGTEPQSLIDAVIGQPEIYLYDVAILLFTLNLWALFFFGRRIYQASHKVWVSMFCQLSLLSFTLLTPKAAYPAPEALLIFVSLCLLGLVAPRIFNQAEDARDTQNKLARRVGLLVGLGLAVKVTFAPFVLLLFLLEQRQRRHALGWVAISFLVLTAVALPQAGRFFSWLSNIVSHSGIHGSGQASVLNLSSIPINALNLWTWFPFFCAALIFSIAILVFLSLNKSRIQTRAAWLLIAIALFQLLLILKHPGAHYMVPVLPIAFVLMAWLYMNVRMPSQWLKLTGGFITLLFVGHSIALTVRGVQKLTVQRTEMTIAMSDINEALAQNPDAIVICSFRCALPQYALSMALTYAPGLISDKTTATLRNFYDFDIFVSQLLSPGRKALSSRDIVTMVRDGHKVILVSPHLYPELQAFKTQAWLKHKSQSAYIILEQ